MISVRVFSMLLSAIAFTAYAQATHAQIYLRLDSGYSMSRETNRVETLVQNQIVSEFSTEAICPGCSAPKHVNNSAIWGGGVGYRFSPTWRADFTISRRGSYTLEGRGFTTAVQTGSSVDIKSWAYMLNVYFDIPVQSSWKPYVGAGLGNARNTVSSFRAPGLSSLQLQGVPQNSKNNIAWSLSTGISYPVGSKVTVDVGYRYLDLGEFESGTRLEQAFGATANCVFPCTPGPSSFINETFSKTTGKLRAHEVTIGLRF